MSTDTATCSSAAVLASSAEASARSGPNPASTNPSSKIANLRRVSWNLTVWLIRLRCHRHQFTSRQSGFHHPMGVKRPVLPLQEPQFTGPGDGLMAGGGFQLAVDRPHLRLDGV